jgi:acetolactate decarboxylase
MLKRAFLLLLCPLVAFAGGTLTQFGTLSSLVAGVYDGAFEVRAIAGVKGGYGLGTFDRLNGEMVIIDGAVYQVPSDGKVRVAPAAQTVPFACVSALERPDFVAEQVDIADKAGIEQYLAAHLPSSNLPAVIVARGSFGEVTTRSVAAQTLPYKPLAEALAADQVVFPLGAQKGTLIGFYFPAAFSGVNAAGWHFHFLNQSKTSGGHLLGFKNFTGAIQIQELTQTHLALPQPASAFGRAELGSTKSAKVKGE